MVLTNGQTYFYIFCQWLVIGYAVKAVYDLVRMYLVHKAPCRGLKALEKDVNNIRRLALVAYQRTSTKDGEKKDA